jgi:hypothetical protein
MAGELLREPVAEDTLVFGLKVLVYEALSY